ncbi:RNA-directed DNA polymerase from mobile element jockey [Eumeta japonica]|uniref:RNA-directed DNA polymerase from mobile element jockey n=1 Tax=Eumeta variegata TaxID=151549 RepID=A0A4C1Y0J3_EUMVA|nr:RNA-directed DNA polymerase from mobile element jockey [Eumeta japonica]
MRLGPLIVDCPPLTKTITNWQKVLAALEEIDTPNLNRIPNDIVSTDDINNSIGTLTNHIRTVIESSFRTVPAKSDRKELSRDIIELIRDKNAALRRAGKYSTWENRSHVRALQRKYDTEHVRRVEEEVRHRVSLPPKDDLDPITHDEVNKPIKGLKIRKAPGRDTNSSKELKCFSAPLIALLVAIFNECIQQCYFPTAWKEAVVIDISKPGKPRDLPASYRPISLLSVLEYISEGFKVKRKIVAVFFEIAKAFDRVWHVGLIHKLYQLELPDRLVLLIYHYISNRHFSFRLDNMYSSMRGLIGLIDIRVKVPQGSTLFPLLYSAYVNVTPRPSTGVQLTLLADDTALYLRSNSIGNIFPRLQRAIDELTLLLRLWRIVVNPDKSASIYFNYSSHEIQFPVPFHTPHLRILNQPIPWQHHYKYLGIILEIISLVFEN